jgi:hypothetical protein
VGRILVLQSQNEDNFVLTKEGNNNIDNLFQEFKERNDWLQEQNSILRYHFDKDYGYVPKCRRIF